MSQCWGWLIPLQSWHSLSCDPPLTRDHLWRIFCFRKWSFKASPTAFYSFTAAQWLCWSSGLNWCPGLLFGWTGAWISVFVYVWALLIFQHCPNSRCLYNTAVLLSLHPPPPHIYLNSGVFYEAEQERGVRRSSRTADVSLHASFSASVNSNLGTNLWVVVAKIDELPDWESALLHSGGNNTSLGLLSRRAPWRVACVRRFSPLPRLPHLSLNLSPAITLCFLMYLLPPSPFFVCDYSDKVLPRQQGPEGVYARRWKKIIYLWIFFPFIPTISICVNLF